MKMVSNKAMRTLYCIKVDGKLQWDQRLTSEIYRFKNNGVNFIRIIRNSIVVAEAPEDLIKMYRPTCKACGTTLVINAASVQKSDPKMLHYFVNMGCPVEKQASKEWEKIGTFIIDESQIDWNQLIMRWRFVK